MKPWQRSDLVPAIEMALARHREAIAMAEANDDLSEQLETRKVLDRAKGLLMDSHGLSEKEAFRFLQTSAMSNRRSMKEVAEDVLNGSAVPE